MQSCIASRLQSDLFIVFISFFCVCVCLSFFIFCQLYLIWIYSIYIVCLRVRVRVLMCCMSRYSQFWYNILIVLLGNNLSQLSKTSKQIHVQLLRYNDDNDVTLEFANSRSLFFQTVRIHRCRMIWSFYFFILSSFR